MRVHLVGNVCNHHFDLTRSLRARGIDAHLFLSPAELSQPQTRPESADPELAGGYPPWIHVVRMPWQRFRPLASADPRTREAIADCDVVHTHANYATWIDRADTPYVIQPFGGDFFVFPFGRPRNRPKHLIPDYRWWGFPARIRRALRGARALILPNVDLLWERAYRALIQRQKIAGIGLVVDTNLFRPSGAAVPPPVAKLREHYDLVLFQATRQIWTERGRRGVGGYSYGNDLLFRGLAGAVRDGASACLLVVDKKSACTAASRALVRELGIEDHVVWIDQMPRHELVGYYQHSDVAVDAFYAGGFGSAALEAMACGAPVLMHLHREGNRALFGEVAPVLEASSAEDVRAAINRYASAKSELQDLGASAVEFVRRHHAHDVVVPRYQALYEAVTGDEAAFEFVEPDLFLRLVAETKTVPVPDATVERASGRC